MNKKLSKPKLRFSISGWAFVLPSIVLFLWLVLWPMVNAFIMSLQKGKGGSVKNFVALVKNGSFLVRITDMTILIEKEFIYGMFTPFLKTASKISCRSFWRPRWMQLWAMKKIVKVI